MNKTDGIEKVDQPIYLLPRDHKLHGGELYEFTGYKEWQYFTAFVKDINTWEDLSLFYTFFRLMWNPETKSCIHWSPLTMGNSTKKIFSGTSALYDAPIEAEILGSSPGTLSFRYGCRGKTVGEVYYTGEEEKWRFLLKKVKDATGPTAELDMTMRVKRPGYCPATQTGVEAQGSPKGFGDNTYNPETVFGLSYYYYAPTCDLEGRVSIGDQKHNVKGEAWFEHQWGNYGSADFMGHAYIWLWFGLDDGTKFSCRYWTLPVTFEPVTRFNRSVYHTPEGQVQHFQGSDAVKISVLRHWASPASGLRYPISLLLETPAGIFALEPDFDEQETYIPHADTYLWEGACRVRGGSLGGPVIGKAYLELPPGAKENLQAKVLNKPYAMKR